jgi:hypothetical protein
MLPPTICQLHSSQKTQQRLTKMCASMLGTKAHQAAAESCSQVAKDQQGYHAADMLPEVTRGSSRKLKKVRSRSKPQVKGVDMGGCTVFILVAQQQCFEASNSHVPHTRVPHTSNKPCCHSAGCPVAATSCKRSMLQTGSCVGRCCLPLVRCMGCIAAHHL